MDSEVVLDVQGLSRKFGEQLAVDELCLQVRAGEILGLVGPNGAGKTTTLRSLAGILPLQDGDVRVAGFDVREEELQAKGALAWVPDDAKPFESLTVLEQLEFNAHLYKTEHWRDRAEALLERFDLSEKRDAIGSELSRGMRQKLALCCAWIADPKLVLMDEPLLGLDPRGIREARLAIREWADSGVAVVLSSHLLEWIEALADRILIMDRGQAVFTGTIDQARSDLAGGSDGSLEEIFLSITGPGATAESVK